MPAIRRSQTAATDANRSFAEVSVKFESGTVQGLSNSRCQFINPGAYLSQSRARSPIVALLAMSVGSKPSSCACLSRRFSISRKRRNSSSVGRLEKCRMTCGNFAGGTVSASAGPASSSPLIHGRPIYAMPGLPGEFPAVPSCQVRERVLTSTDSAIRHRIGGEPTHVLR